MYCSVEYTACPVAKKQNKTPSWRLSCVGKCNVTAVTQHWHWRFLLRQILRKLFSQKTSAHLEHQQNFFFFLRKCIKLNLWFGSSKRINTFWSNRIKNLTALWDDQHKFTALVFNRLKPLTVNEIKNKLLPWFNYIKNRIEKIQCIYQIHILISKHRQWLMMMIPSTNCDYVIIVTDLIPSIPKTILWNGLGGRPIKK